jgi:hypothetical protein
MDAEKLFDVFERVSLTSRRIRSFLKVNYKVSEPQDFAPIDSVNGTAAIGFTSTDSVAVLNAVTHLRFPL